MSDTRIGRTTINFQYNEAKPDQIEFFTIKIDVETYEEIERKSIGFVLLNQTKDESPQ